MRLIATGETERAEISFEWLLAGRVEVDADGQLSFPRLPASPGLYRFSLFTTTDLLMSAYIGESINLARRMQNYRNPGPTQATNERLNARLLDHLANGGQVEVEAGLELWIDGSRMHLAAKSSRLLGENLALSRAAIERVRLENL